MAAMYSRLLGLFLLLAAADALAVNEFTETLPSGAKIRIATPDGWQPGGTLVLYQHGFNMEFDDDPDLGPLRDRQLADGYAVAATGYRGRGWALFTAVQDNLDLVQRFEHYFGRPGHLIAMGGSMGGLIAHKLAESPGFETLDGVYSLCPPAAGSRTWDTAFDLRMAYDAVCEGVGGGELPNGDEPYPWAYNEEDIPNDGGDLFGSQVFGQTLARITQCTGVTLNPALRTSAQRERLQRLMQFGAFTDEDFFLTNLAYAIYAMSDVLRAPDKLDGRNPFTTRGVIYGDDLIQARVPAIANDPIAWYDFRRSSDLFGSVADDVRMVSLHTSRDELVRPAHQSQLRLLYGGQVLSGIVNEPSPSHCGFTLAEVTAGWDMLKLWLNSPEFQPVKSDLVERCATLVAGGMDGPCRFDPGIEPGSLAQTMRPRSAQTMFYDLGAANITGSWYDPARSGEGLLVESLGGNQVLVIWFTYPPAGGGEQAWLLGVGTASGNGVEVSDLRYVRGARFGNAFDPNAVERQPWGKLKFAISALPGVQPGNPPAFNQLQMTIDYQGPAQWGSGRREFRQLLEVGLNRQTPISPFPDTRPWQHSGTFYDPARSGEGFMLQQFAAGNGWLTAMTWFTFDNAGNPMWLAGIGTEQGNRVTFDVIRPVGTQFGDDFLASEVERRHWGSATLTFDGCDAAQLQWQADEATYGSGTLNTQRLTMPSPVWACQPE